MSALIFFESIVPTFATTIKIREYPLIKDLNKTLSQSKKVTDAQSSFLSQAWKCKGEDKKSVLGSLQKLNNSSLDVWIKTCGHSAIPVLIDALSHEQDWRNRIIAAYVLGEMGRDETGVVPALISALHDKNFKVRYVAAKSLGNFPSQNTLAVLIEALKDDNENVRYGAVQSLEKINLKSSKLISALIQSMKDKNWFVRSGSSRILINIGADAVPNLINVLYESDDPTFSYAVHALTAIGSVAVPNLISSLNHTDSHGRQGNITVLKEIGVQAIPALVAALQSQDQLIRKGATQTLGYLGSQSESVVPALIQALNDETIRVDAIDALNTIGHKAIPTLIKAFRESGSIAVHENAGLALALIKPREQSSIPVLIQALTDKDESIQQSARFTLLNLGHKAFPALIKAFRESNNISVRESVAGVLAELKPKEQSSIPIAALVQALRDKDETIQKSAHDALVSLGFQAIPPLIKVLRDEYKTDRGSNVPEKQDIITPDSPIGNIPISQPDLHDSIIQIFRKIGVKAVPILIQVLQKEDGLVRRDIIKALGEFGSDAQSAVPFLITSLKDKDPDIRYTVVESLGKIGIQAISPIIDALRDENKSVRNVAVQSLREIGPGAQSAVPYLITSLKDEDLEVRNNAVFALSEIGSQSIPTLIAALKNENILIQEGAIKILGEIGPQAQLAVPNLIDELTDNKKDQDNISNSLIKIGSDAVPELIKALKTCKRNRNSKNYAAIAYIIGKIENPNLPFIHGDIFSINENQEKDNKTKYIPSLVASVPNLVDTLEQDQDLVIRASTIALLGKIGTQAKAALPVLLKLLKHNNQVLQILAADSIVQIDSRIIAPAPILIKTLRSDDPSLRYNAIVNITKLGSEVAPLLIEAYGDRNPLVRKGAVQALALVHPKEKAAIPVLTQALNDEDLVVRISAAQTLILMGDKAQSVLLVLTKAMESELEFGSNDWYLVWGLEDLGSQAVPTFISALKDKRPLVRQRAIQSLGSIGSEAHSAIPALIQALNDKNVSVHTSAVDALGRIGSKAQSAAIPVLIQALNDKNVSVRTGAVEALGLMGNKAQPAIPALIQSLKDRTIHSLIVSTLSQLGIEVIPALSHALKDKNSLISEGAIEALDLFNSPEINAVPSHLLINSLKKDSTRANAISILEKRDFQTVPELLEVFDLKQQGIPILAENALHGFDDDIRRSAAYILGLKNSEINKTKNELLAIAINEENNFYIRWMATVAIEKIESEINLQDLYLRTKLLPPHKVECPDYYSFHIYESICLELTSPVPTTPAPPTGGGVTPPAFGGANLSPQDLFTWFKEKFGK